MCYDNFSDIGVSGYSQEIKNTRMGSKFMLMVNKYKHNFICDEDSVQ